MRLKDKKWWLITTKYDGVVVNHIICAPSIKRFVENLSATMEVLYQARITWHSLCHLVGCVKPPDQDNTDFAVGPLGFDYHQQETVLHVVR